jgi:hypothetical protein
MLASLARNVIILGMTESYIDRCVEAVGTVDVDSLSGLEVGPAVGNRGSQFAMRALGRLGVLHEDVHVGLKVPNNGSEGAAELRLQSELASIELLLNHIPELSPMVPKFLALLSVDENDPVAILTEDASSGGELEMWPLSFVGGESELACSISEAFSAVEGAKVDRATIDYSLAFMVGDQQRLLDFTPSPVRSVNREENERVSDRLFDLIYEDRALTVDVGSQSPLGLSLAEHFKK